jgi:hypothetical protein
VGPFNTVRGAIENVIQAVKDLTNWLNNIKVPNIKIPHIPGVNLAVSPVPAVAGVGAFAAPAVPVSRAGMTTAGGGVVINVNGALDPEAVARQIQSILGGHVRRVRGRAA